MAIERPIKSTKKKFKKPRSMWRQRKKEGSIQKLQSTKSHKTRIWTKVNLLLIFIIVACIVAFILYAPFFHLSSVVNEGESLSPRLENDITSLIREQLQKSHLNIIPEKNYFLFSEEPILLAFENHPYIETLRLDTRFFKTVTYTYTLREPGFIAVTPQSIYTVDPEGYALELLENDFVYQSLPHIEISNELDLATKVIFTEHLDDVQAIHEVLQNRELASGQFVLDTFSSTIRYIHTQGWYILFAMGYDLTEQLNTLETLLEDTIDDPSTLEYIDLRVENWIYYK